MAVQGVGPRQALAEMKAFGYNPVREPYLAYLGDFVTKLGRSLQARRTNAASALLGRLLGNAS